VPPPVKVPLTSQPKLDEEHNRLRREIFAEICRDIARVHFQIDR